VLRPRRILGIIGFIVIRIYDPDYLLAISFEINKHESQNYPYRQCPHTSRTIKRSLLVGSYLLVEIRSTPALVNCGATDVA